MDVRSAKRYAYDARVREAMAADPNERHHGTKTGVKLGCRCEVCEAAREAFNAEQRERRRAKNREYKARRKAREAERKAREAAERAAHEEAERMERERLELGHGFTGKRPNAVKAEKVAKARKAAAKRRTRKDCNTIGALDLPMMDKPSIRMERCAICGATWPLNQHHIVWRSRGKWVENGHEHVKPTITLCGDGNGSGCHGLAHAMMLHFRWVDTLGRGDANLASAKPTIYGAGHWEYLKTKEPTKYRDALQMKGWKRICKR